MLSEFLLSEMASLRASHELPLHRQLYEALRRALLDGHLQADERLASSRDLAKDLDLSRNTVITALNQLVVEGYLVCRTGSGTYASGSLPKAIAKHRSSQDKQTPSLSSRGAALTSTHTADQLEVQPFTGGVTDFSAFPIALWQRLQNKHWRMSYPDMLDYSYSGGHAPLRRAVANYLRVFRSVHLDSDQVIITAGTQQSISLCAHLLADHGDTAWIEDPAYWGAIKALSASGLKLHPVAVDAEGVAPSLEDENTPPRLIYVTPSHQYPTGAVMSLARRQQLLATARRHSSWILEDDYDSEFRFSGAPMSSLEGLDSDDRVLYMGTFSKVLYPGLKLGYLVVPEVSRGAWAPGYVWGDKVRQAFAGIASGTALATALHAPDPDEGLAVICRGCGVPDADARRLSLVVYLRAFGPPEAPTHRRVATVHEIRGVEQGTPDARLLYRWIDPRVRIE